MTETERRTLMQFAAHPHPGWLALAIDALFVAAAISVVAVMVPWPAGLGRTDSRSGGEASVLSITPSGGQPSGPQLTSADVSAIVASVPGVTLLSRIVFDTTPVGSAVQDPRLTVEAVDPSYALIPGVTVARGGFFTAQDAAAANRVAVLGAQASRGLFSGSESPLGQTVRIAAVPFTVVGVLAAQSGGSLDTSTNAVLIPFQSGQIRLFGAAPLGEIVLQTADASQTQSMVVQIQRVLRTRHQIQAGQSDGFTITLANSLGTSAKGPLDNLAARVVNLSQQYACVAKALC